MASLAVVKRMAKRRAASEADWRQAIRDAHANGIPIRQIGAAAGVSHVRVLQITRGE